MANPYTSVTVTGYNASPPSDDGVQEAQNQVEWAKTKTKIGDPLKTAVEAIDTNTLAAFASVVSAPPTPRGYIDGFIMSNDTDADHDIAISVGTCKNADNDATLTTTATITKQLDASWAEGDDAGGRPSAVSISADTWYHVFVIAKADGTVDAGFDTSITAANLLTDATEYTDYRRIGSVLTDSSSDIIRFEQEGNWFQWRLMANDLSTTNPGTAGVQGVVSTPLGIKVLAQVSADILDLTATSQNDIIHMVVRDPDSSDTAASSTNFTHRAVATGSTEPSNASGTVMVRTDTSSQIEYRIDKSDADVSVRIKTLGWQDKRGKNV